MTDTSTAGVAESRAGLAPWSLKDAPCFIERQFPVGRVSAEAYKERKAGAGQTLTALGSYWKGRKPLILVRAVVLGCLLPATDDAAADLDIFLRLMAMDDGAFGRRFDGSAAEFARLFPDDAPAVATNERVAWRAEADLDTRRRAPDAASFACRFPAEAERFTEIVLTRWSWRDDVSVASRQDCIARAFASLPYGERLALVLRPEECNQHNLLAPVWDAVNAHLGASAQSLPDLVAQLGIARFGHRPKLADTFCGGGSIPFEAARMGCDVYASDLNPIACMLTWGAFNIIGASEQRRAEIAAEQRRVAEAVDAEITRLGIEHDEDGNRAKAYLYCLETRCPKTGWMVPMAPSWVISKTRNVVAKLVPDPAAKHYRIDIRSGVSAAEMAEAEQGTVQGGRLVHPMFPDRSGVEIKTIRGDYRDAAGVSRNRLRQWELLDFIPRPDDIFQERLYCIQWTAKESLERRRPETFFAAVTEADLARERQVEAVVAENLADWQEQGLAPDMRIEQGENTTQPIRERGWTHWHHLFGARSLLGLTILAQASAVEFRSIFAAVLPIYIDNSSRLCGWNKGHPGSGEFATNVFNNQALNTHLNYASRSIYHISTTLGIINTENTPTRRGTVAVSSAETMKFDSDVIVTDPPYADAVNYHEITEFFIAWLRKNPPPPFDQWTWDSRRDLAIKGKDEQFRRDMVAAYTAMTRHMPDNGMQVVMFTHQHAGVWADLAAILWAAGLRVSAAWNIVTETKSSLKDGNYVQGTVCLVLRKRLGQANARRMEIESEIEDAVAEQLDRLAALDESWQARSSAESLYTDGDLTLAAYAAALQVVTAYSSIDRQPLDRDLYRKLGKNEKTMLRDLVDYAAQVANAKLVPDGFPNDMWRDLDSPERFYVRMLDMEAKGAAKVADFQNFAKSFAFGGYAEVMASTTANAAALAGAADLKGRMLAGEGFWGTQTRQVLFAVWKTMESGQPDPKRGVTILKTEYAADYWKRRQHLIALAGYIGLKTRRSRPAESAAALELAEALRNDRV